MKGGEPLVVQAAAARSEVSRQRMCPGVNEAGCGKPLPKGARKY